MLRSFFPGFILLFCIHTSWSQQIIIHGSVEKGPIALFGLRYNDFSNGYAVLNQKGIFKEKLVHKIYIYNYQNSLFYFFELDRNGKIVEEGYKGKHYYRTVREKIAYQDTFECKTWVSGPMLMRKDTLEHYHKIYKNGDTLMEYDDYVTEIQKRGKLINEQNAFYSSQYLNHPGSFKENYDPDFLYTCVREYQRKNFAASVKNNQVNLDTNAIKQHRFYKMYRQPGLRKQFVEGEEFVEPLIQGFRCGTIVHSREPYQTLNNNGLFDKQYTDESENILMFYAKYEYYKEP